MINPFLKIKNLFKGNFKEVTLNEKPVYSRPLYERLRRKSFEKKPYKVLFDLYVGKNSKTQQSIVVYAHCRSEALEAAISEAQEMIRIVPQKVITKTASF